MSLYVPSIHMRIHSKLFTYENTLEVKVLCVVKVLDSKEYEERSDMGRGYTLMTRLNSGS